MGIIKKKELGTDQGPGGYTGKTRILLEGVLRHHWSYSASFQKWAAENQDIRPIGTKATGTRHTDLTISYNYEALANAGWSYLFHNLRNR